jgi:hypothetical protein
MYSRLVPGKVSGTTRAFTFVLLGKMCDYTPPEAKRRIICGETEA